VRGAGTWLATALLAAAPPAAAQTVYIAFGDSITAGSFDDPARAQKGYPPRLEDLLVARGVDAVVVNHGMPGESTAEALSRIDGVLAGGGDVLLLMEGTNDVGARVSNETILTNLSILANRAENQGLEVVHGTIIPRHPTASYDPRNIVTRDIAGGTRELAWEEGRNLADPFEAFRHLIPDAFDTLYVGGEDKLHPNAAGYDALAEVFADALTGVDGVWPVIGRLFPHDDAQGVDPRQEIVIDLYDFGAGIDVDATRLLVGEEEVPAEITGDERLQRIRYRPDTPFSGVVFLGLEAQDLATPPNRREGTLLQFVVAGATFLTGDITRDGRVDGADLVDFARAFGAQKGTSRYKGFADFNGDNVVDGNDLAILASNFGERSF
jgi:acyl-CoA thioesterase-1